MNNMKNSLLLFFSLAFFYACAQPRNNNQLKNKLQAKNGIIKTEVFLQERMPGTIAVDENGNPMRQGPFLDYKAIVETAPGKQPTFNRVWIDGKSFSVLVNEVIAPYKVGLSKESQQPINVDAGKGNKIWELSLQEDEVDKSLKKSNSTGIVIEGSYNGKAFTLPLNNIPVRRLSSPLYM
jgi:hypothetical protein